jgi:hypothetical protein
MWLLAPMLTLIMLALSVVNGTAPAAAQPANQPTEVLSAAELQARRERIGRFFQDRGQRRKIVATTVTPSGQTIDWIRPESQTADGFLAQPPDPSVADASPDTEMPPQFSPPGLTAPVEGRVQTEVQRYPSARGPAGTVPVVRFDVEKYLASVRVPPENPQDVFRKMPPPETPQAIRRELLPPAPESNNRYYVYWDRFGTFYGSVGQINIWNTAGPVNNETSIAQVAVTRGTPTQTVEAGKIEYQSLNGDLQPHLFTWYTTNGYASTGDWVGGYNFLVDGWIQVSPTMMPGMSLVGMESQLGGHQIDLTVEVRLYQGNWWVNILGEWAGYYPYCKGGDAPPCDQGTLFSASGIRDYVSRLVWYGEVYDSSAPAPTSTDMGSGRFASAGYRYAAYFRVLRYFPNSLTYRWWDSGALRVTDAACYSGSGPFYSSDAGWRNWFYYGGPGKEASGCR